MKPIKRLIYGFLAASLVLSTTSCGEFIDIFSEGSSGDFEAPDELGDVELPEDATNDFEAPDFPVSTEGFQAPLSEVMLQKGSDQSGQIDQDNDMQVISAEYEVRLKNPEQGQMAHIQIPLSQVPEDLSHRQIQVERLDESTGQWQAAGNFSWYDAASKSVWFRDQLPSKTVAVGDFSTQQISSQSAKYRIRIYLFSNDLTVYREGSRFKISYYPSHLGNKNKIKSDSEWSSPNGSQESGIPDYIEDLDTALNEAYQAMLKISHSEGKVFKPLPIQEVIVTHTGPNAGDSRLGGPLQISNNRIGSYKDMQLTAAHELAHVFQGQYYSLKGLFGGQSNNTWFIEASANYYAARVNGLDDAAKKDFYTDFYTDYLSVSLTSNSDNSMYAAGHFLDWLSENHGLNLVGDALRLSIGNDMIGLSKAIALGSNGSSSIADAYEDYLKEILTQPEDTAGFNRAIRTGMTQYSLGNGDLSRGTFTLPRRYARLKKTLPPLTAAMVNLNTTLLTSPDEDEKLQGLFVMVNNKNEGSLLKGTTYLMDSALNKPYLTANPIDKYLDYTTFSEHHELAMFEDFSQMLYNSSPATEANVDMSYYLLFGVAMDYPYDEVSEESPGTTATIDIKQSLGDIPRDYIAGFNVYDYKGNLFKGPIPVPAEDDFVPVQLPGFKQYHFSIADKLGNEWPYQLILSSAKEVYSLSEDDIAEFTAHTIGFEDNDLIWAVTGGGAEPISTQGKQASFTMPRNAGVVTVTATSRKYPFVTGSIFIYRQR